MDNADVFALGAGEFKLVKNFSKRVMGPGVFLGGKRLLECLELVLHHVDLQSDKFALSLSTKKVRLMH